MYCHRQLHLWITDHDYSMLRDLADERKETLSSVVRRLIKQQHGEPFLEPAAAPDPPLPENLSL